MNELPSVMGAFVREDVNGHPREVHLLVTPGPDVRTLAKDVRYLLEQRLGIPVDQRVISIAQLVDAETREREQGSPLFPAAPSPAADEEEGTADRLVLSRTESRLVSGRLVVSVALTWGAAEHVGEGSDMESAAGRARAGAAATLAAVTLATERRLRLDLETASVVRAFDREFVLVSVLASGKAFGRRPISLVGAHPADADIETASILATLKAVNRVAVLGLEAGEAGGLRRRPGRSR